MLFAETLTNAEFHHAIFLLVSRLRVVHARPTNNGEVSSPAAWHLRHNRR
jgi:hypothetical protein